MEMQLPRDALKTVMLKLKLHLNYSQTFSKSQNHHEVRPWRPWLSKKPIFSMNRKKDKNHEEKNVHCRFSL